MASKNQKSKTDSQSSDKVLYTLRDNNLFVKGLGTLTKDPKNPQPLTDEQLQAIFDVASKNGISKEQAIKKHLVKLRAKVEEEVIPVPNELEKFEVDNEE